jgi:hypothetical protein
MADIFTTEQEVDTLIDGTFVPLKKSLSQDGANRGPLWLAYHNLILFSRWGERLPATERDLKLTLAMEDPGRYAWFSDMLSSYTDVKNISQNFDANVFTAIGDLTESLRLFAKSAKTAEDGDFNTIIDLLKAKQKDDALDLILALQEQATANAEQAKGVNDALAKFASDLNIAEKQLEIVQEMVDKDSQTSQERIDQMQGGKEVEGSLKYYEDLRDKAKKEYDHDVVVASTTPSYAWVCPFGTIAAATVAGVYGKKATVALRAYKEAMTQIEGEQRELEIALKVRSAQKLAMHGLGMAKQHCQDAINESEVVQKGWMTINGDLGAIAEKLRAMTGTTDEGEKLKGVALVIHFAKQAGHEWAELWPMIEELSSAAEGTHNMELLDAGAMADRIDEEIKAKNKAA